jgi:hypothetical protein
MTVKRLVVAQVDAASTEVVEEEDGLSSQTSGTYD